MVALRTRWRSDADHIFCDSGGRSPGFHEPPRIATIRAAPTVMRGGSGKAKIREGDDEFPQLPNLRIRPRVQAPVSRRAGSRGRRGDAAGAGGVRSGRAEID